MINTAGDDKTIPRSMFHKSTLLCFVWLYSATFAFDAGWTANFLVANDATHYSLTECALLELAANNLRDVYSITSIHSVVEIRNGLCQASVIFEMINEALAQLKIDRFKISTLIPIGLKWVIVYPIHP
jgi:hypothetical protein